MAKSKAILIDITKCIGCKSCEAACKQLHGFPQDSEAKLSPTAYTIVEEHVWPILCLSFVSGLAQAFGGPAYLSLIPTLVDREDMPNAIALNSIQFNLAVTIGPALGGLTLARFGEKWCFGLNALSFLAPIISLSIISAQFIPEPAKESMFESLKEGFKFIWHHGSMVAIIVLAFAMTFLSMQWIRNTPRGEYADENARQDSGQRQKPGIALHFIHIPIGFALRFLHDHRPIEGCYGAVSTEHLDPLLAAIDIELASLGQERFVAGIDKRSDYVQVLHVLAGSKLRSRGGNEASLRVDNVRGQAATTNFSQPSNQELQIHDRRNHPQKAWPILHRYSDQENRPRILALADHKGLSVVNSSVARRGVSTLKFTLQKGIGSNVSGKDSLGFGVQKAGISNLVSRRRDEILKQGAQFRRFNVFFPDVASGSHLHRGR